MSASLQREPDDDRGRTSTGARPDEGLAQRLSEMARSLEAQPDLEQTLDGIVHAAVLNIVGADHASITRVDAARHVTTLASTDDLVDRVDRVQYEVDQGPCLDSIRYEATVRSDDLRAERRWPDFATRAADLGVLSMLSFQLFVREHDLGALNLYGAEVNAFDDTDEQIGLLLASHAAIAMIGAAAQHNLNIALRTRDRIGQAKGIMMERHKITDQQAFELLLRASRHTNQKLRDIAEEVASTGKEPGRR